jgi:hypothetical protein
MRIANTSSLALTRSLRSLAAGPAILSGLATNLHQLGVFDKTIQRILRHANVAVTQNCHIKTADSEIAAAMQQFERSLEYAPKMHLEGLVKRA